MAVNTFIAKGKYMTLLRVAALGLSLLLTGCSALSEVSWSSALPWNWFGDGLTVSDNGVGRLGATTALQASAVTEALKGDYTLRSGMRMDNGQVVPFFEALKENNVMLVISGQSGHVNRINIKDPNLVTTTGVKIGTPFSALFSRAFGACESLNDDERNAVICQAPQLPHIHYVFSGNWQGPEGLMPPDDTLKDWKVSRIVWSSE